MAITETCLKTGHDVIIDKMIWDINDTLDQLHVLGDRYHAEVHEIILDASRETTRKGLKSEVSSPTDYSPLKKLSASGSKLKS